jgi:hypothetical protein
MVNGVMVGAQRTCSKPGCANPLADNGQRYCPACHAEASREYRRKVRQQLDEYRQMLRA